MIIDIHGHIGRILPDRREFMDVTNLIAKMDAWGIDKTCVLPVSEHPEGAYLEADTEDIIAACGYYPERLIPFCLIDPRYGNRPDMNFSYLLEEYKARGCKGLGEFLPKMDFDDIRCMNLYRQAGKSGLPVLFDMQDGPYSYGLCDNYGLPKLEYALKACPETIFIGHGPTFWAEISADVPVEDRSGYPGGLVQQGGAVPKLMRKYHNLWAETSARSGYNAIIRDPGFGLEFLDEFQDKLIFGIDSCRRSDVNQTPPIIKLFNDLRQQRRLTEGAIEKITWKNCKQLLKI
ncbi:MAG: amidohydrolase [Ruminiclostridium sp.]|nr:amidohydrolase [Ruminiclostridium sp.]